ncbi:MAG: hypothetical protein HYZ36_08765, partial [Pedosphaera parvula]|nr:hypothetical protein [Pedosphaera parvula]
MSDENKLNDDDRNDRKNGDFRSRPSPWVIWIAIIGFIVLLITFREHADTKVKTLTYNQFVTAVESNLVM